MGFQWIFLVLVDNQVNDRKKDFVYIKYDLALKLVLSIIVFSYFVSGQLIQLRILLSFECN